MLLNHPTKDIIASNSSSLEGKKIVLAMCGSVGIIKAPELARLLIREGADVIPVMSEAALNLLGAPMMHWATGNKVITSITGAVEHVELCGNTSTKADLLLIYPATANTLSKIATGIDDTPVTTFATTAIGEGIPVMIIPAMHEPMFSHPAVKENIEKLRNYCLTVLEPVISEGKAKILTPEEVSSKVIQLFNPTMPSLLKKAKKKILITSGRTIESIDPFRIITNRSSGKMGAALAKAALENDFAVTIVSGAVDVPYPNGISKLIKCESTVSMLETITKEITTTHYDVIICAAAVADWTPAEVANEKISTEQNSISLELVATPKIIDTIKINSPESLLVAFRALSSMTNEQMIENGYKRLAKANADFICINAIDQPDSGFDKETNSFIILSKSGQEYSLPTQSKESCAREIISLLL